MNKIYIILQLCFIITLVSCTKEKKSVIVNEPSLEGSWKMILYVDSTLGVTETKADSYLHQNIFMADDPYPPIGDVSMKITLDSLKRDTGIIVGSTIFNGFTLNFAVTEEKHLKILEGGAWTLAMDPPWGNYCFNVMQSVKSYSFDGEERLHIEAPSKTLIFIRN